MEFVVVVAVVVVVVVSLQCLLSDEEMIGLGCVLISCCVVTK